VWVAVLVLAVCAAPIAGSVGPLTKSIMDLSPVDGSAAASSWRNAVWSFGGTVGGVLVAGTAFTVFQSALSGILSTADLSTEQAAALAASVRDGAIVTELANNELVTDPPSCCRRYPELVAGQRAERRLAGGQEQQARGKTPGAHVPGKNPGETLSLQPGGDQRPSATDQGHP
jgi:hypothetical protein